MSNRPGLAKQLLVALFLATLGALVVRGHRTRDDHYGFSMFRSLSLVDVSMTWIEPRGTKRAYDSRGELRNKGRMLEPELGKRGWISGDGNWMHRVPQYAGWAVSHNRQRRTAESLEAVVTCKHVDGSTHEERWTFPVTRR